MSALVPPFTRETAIAKVRMAEDAWNSRDPHRVSLAYTEDSRWRNRAEFINGRAEIIAFLKRKWHKELDSADQRTLGIHRQPHRRALRL
jgi:nuclear transport factor 2 (NTF2) superfamily protein